MAINKVVKEEKKSSVFSDTGNQKSGRVRSTREARSRKNREVPRRELAPEILNEFVDRINSECKDGTLPYGNYNLNMPGSANEVYAHYYADSFDEKTFSRMAQELSKEREVSYDEAQKIVIDMQLKMADWKYGLAFILTNDAKKFYYNPETKDLWHDYEKKKKLTGAERAFVEGLSRKATGDARKFFNDMLD